MILQHKSLRQVTVMCSPIVGRIVSIEGFLLCLRAWDSVNIYSS